MSSSDHGESADPTFQGRNSSDPSKERDSGTHSTAIEAAFLKRLLDDREEGREVSLQRYQEAYPGFESIIADLYAIGQSKEDVELGPERIGRFELVRLLGSGGQGFVHEAVDSRLQRRVALKVLTGLDEVAPESRARFRREAEMASRLDHPAICTVYDADLESDTPYIAMRLVEGEPLSRTLSRARGKPSEGLAALVLPPRDEESLGALLRYFAEIADALAGAHALGVVHRDVKPGNLMVSPAGDPVILDFGLASAMEGDSLQITRTGEVFGTPKYMAPEQVDPTRGAVDGRTDIHALAACCYETCSLVAPFSGVTREELFHEILMKDCVDIRRHDPSLPEDLAVVLATALQKDPDDRYATSALLAEDLRAIADHRPIQARPISVGQRMVRWARREPGKARLLGTVLALSVLLLGSVGYLAARWSDFREARLEREQDAFEQRIETALEQGFFELEEYHYADAIQRFRDVEQEVGDESMVPVIGQVIGLLRERRPGDAWNLLERDGRDDPALTRCRAAVLLYQGKVEEAERVQSSLGPPTTEDDLLVSSLLHMSEFPDTPPDFDRALALLSRLIFIAERPRALYHIERGRAALGAGDRDAWSDSSAALAAHWPDNSLLFAHRARGHVDTNPELALELARKCIRQRSDYALAWLILAQALTAVKEFDEADAAASRALDLQPGTAVIYSTRAYVRLMAGRLEEAEVDADLALASDPGVSHGSYVKGIALARRGEVEEALRRFRVVRSAYSQPALMVNVGECLFQLGKVDEARENFQAAIDVSPDLDSAHTGLAIIAASSGDMETAIVSFRRVAEIRPDDLRAHRNLGTVLMKTGRLAELAEIMEEWLSRHPDSLSHSMELARMYLTVEEVMNRDAGAKHVAEARRLWEVSEERDPDMLKTIEGLEASLNSGS